MSDIIASEFVGDQPSRFTPLAFEQATEKPFSSLLIATALHEDINDIVVLIDRAPEILALVKPLWQKCGLCKLSTKQRRSPP